MPLPERTIHFELKDQSPDFDHHFTMDQELIDPLYPDALVFTPNTETGNAEALHDKGARDDFNTSATELQRLIDAGWGPMAMMRETGDVKNHLVIYHKGDGFYWAERHIRTKEFTENRILNRDSIGLLDSKEISALTRSMGMEPGQIPPEIMLKAYHQRINGFRWINNKNFIDRVEEMDQSIREGKKPQNSPIINAELDNQTNNYWERDSSGLPIINPEDAFPTNLPLLDAIASHIYITRGSEDTMSRNGLVDKDTILSPVGDHWRLETVVAPMPTSQGSIEYLSTAARMNALAVVPRNGQFADIEFRKEFTRTLIDDLKSRTVPGLDEEYQAKAQQMWLRNVSVAVGINDTEVNSIKEFIETGVRSFRLYTVATDGQMKAQLSNIFGIIDEFNKSNPADKIELFVGQMTHEDQLGPRQSYDDDSKEEESDESLYELFEGFDEETITKYISGFYFGNGGGSMCSTASTGMGVNTLLLLHRFRNDPRFKNASFIIEGGITIKEFPLLQIGAHAESIASQAVTVESPGGELAYVGKAKSDRAYEVPPVGKPQVGEASRVSSKIEDGLKISKGKRMEKFTEMPYQTEGQVSIKLIDPELPSVAQILRERTKYLAQVMVKMGVVNMEQLHTIGTFQTAEAMQRIFGPNWRNQRDLGMVRPREFERWGEHLRKVLQAPPDVPLAKILLRAGITMDSDQPYYIIPTHMRRATAEQRIEGSPNGAGVTKIK